MGWRRHTLGWLSRRPRARVGVLLAPGTLWLLAFFLVPILMVLLYSFMPRGIYGGVERGFTLEHYRRFWDASFDRLDAYLKKIQKGDPDGPGH